MAVLVFFSASLRDINC